MTQSAFPPFPGNFTPIPEFFPELQVFLELNLVASQIFQDYAAPGDLKTIHDDKSSRPRQVVT